MLNPWKIMFFLILMFGTFLAVLSPTWIMAWIGLEINMMALLPILLNFSTPRETEASLKYFLIQTMASVLFIASSFISSMVGAMMSNSLIFMIITISMLMKLGSAPFHLWVPQVMEGLKWSNCLLVLIWQKIAPLFIILNVLTINNKFNLLMINLAILLSSVLSAISGLSQFSVRKIMAFSSINHLSWILMSMMLKLSFLLVYFICYSCILVSTIFMFIKNNINSVSSISLNSSKEKMMIFISLLSLGGLPPFMGFFPKLIILMNSSINPLLLTVVILSGIITLFFYLRISFNSAYQSSIFMWKESMINNPISFLMVMITNTSSLIFLAVFILV